jgi:O-antigen/teichoic acid export membrane protein
VTSVFLAAERPIVPALVNLLNNVFSTALRLGALLLGFGVVGVAWSVLAATVLNAAIFVVLMRRHFGWPGWQWDGSLARSMMQAAFPLMLNSLLMIVFFRFDTFIISAFHGSRAVAEYSAAYKFPPIALILPPIIVNALFPRFSRQAVDDRAGLLRGYRLTLRVLLMLALLLATVVSSLAPWLLRILAPNAGARAELALALLIWFVPMSYVNGIAQYVLIAVDRQGQITRAFALTAVFNLAANLLLVPRFGIAAAALTTVASEIVLYLPFRRVLREELGAAPLLELAWRPTIAALAAGSAILVLRSQPWLALPIGLACYGVILWILGTFTDEDRALVQRVVGRKRA